VLDLVDAHPWGMTQPAIAAVLGVTRQRVQQIEARAVGRVRLRLPYLAPDLAPPSRPREAA
jgi:DNA-directed RNA polymerase sigma subunit (sigma70/sigma32)